MSSLDHKSEEGQPASPEHGYWRSLSQLASQEAEDGGDYEGAPLEFPASAVDEQAPTDPLSRRNFAKVMGASLALAGVAGAGCKRWEKDEIVPLARRPEDMIPGIPQVYATAWDFGGVGHALVATSYEGRPIKVDGNPDHPYASGGVVQGTKSRGASTAFAQATVLDLYDPDRSKLVTRDGKGASFADFTAWLNAEKGKLGGGRVRFLSEASSSPTVARLKADLGARWYEWEPLSNDNERAGLRLAFGRSVRPIAHLERAKTIVTLDCDIFVEHPAALRYSRDWARSRRFGTSTLGDGVMNRLYAVESAFTSTGAVADHRLPIRSELILPFVMALDALLAGGAMPDNVLFKDDKVKRHLEAIADELRDNAGAGIVLAGRRQPKEVHAYVAKINDTIRAVGSTLDYHTDPTGDRPDHLEGLTALAKEIEAGQVDYLFILGGNPVYDAPADLAFGDLLAKVKNGTVHLSEYEDETSKKTTWHVPRAHYLEAWGDVRAYDGTHTIAQPLIQPMYGGISVIELLQLLAGKTPDGMQAVADTFGELRSTLTWRQAVHDGYVPGTQLALDNGVVVNRLPPVTLSQSQTQGMRLPKDSVEVTFVPSTMTWDGRFANNAWLQETPDFLTKVTWDNYALVGPATAKELGLSNDTKIKIVVNGRELEIACYTMPGQAPYSIGVVLGGGRTAAGEKGGNGKKHVGFDSYKIRATDAFDIVSGAKVTSTGTGYTLASTQEHWDISAGLKKDIAQKGIADRLYKLVEEASLEDANKATWRAQEEMLFPNVNLWDEEKPEGHRAYPDDGPERVHKWGMTIDLGNCTGCNACSVACYAENNIPVVGKEQVIWNREMSWIRIDRYFSGSPEDPQVVHQPLGCVHCENAPCETVCPVGATLHSTEGLNDMIYNRCIGTRYCLNNCSYRVRRFNFFDYNKQFKEARNQVRRLLFNPEVTVRHRGVMEKCTYCVQRIQNAKIKAKNDRVELVDGENAPKTACQEVCPTEAIVFGDLNDPKSRVRRIQAEDRRDYEMLGDLNTKPRTHYLARVRNPNPKLEQGHGHRGSH